MTPGIRGASKKHNFFGKSSHAGLRIPVDGVDGGDGSDGRAFLDEVTMLDFQVVLDLGVLGLEVRQDDVGRLRGPNHGGHDQAEL